jgi:hypothetical protein
MVVSRFIMALTGITEDSAMVQTSSCTFRKELRAVSKNPKLNNRIM